MEETSEYYKNRKSNMIDPNYAYIKKILCKSDSNLNIINIK